jgi:hypothetical protein
VQHKLPIGGVFESDEFSPNIPQLGRRTKGLRFNRYHKEAQTRNPHAKNPGVNSAIVDPPPDLRLKPPMRGEVDKNDRGRSKLYDDYVPAWNKPTSTRTRKLSRGDIMQSKAPWY